MGFTIGSFVLATSKRMQEGHIFISLHAVEFCFSFTMIRSLQQQQRKMDKGVFDYILYIDSHLKTSSLRRNTGFFPPSWETEIGCSQQEKNPTMANNYDNDGNNDHKHASFCWQRRSVHELAMIIGRFITDNDKVLLFRPVERIQPCLGLSEKKDLLEKGGGADYAGFGYASKSFDEIPLM